MELSRSPEIRPDALRAHSLASLVLKGGLHRAYLSHGLVYYNTSTPLRSVTVLR